LALALVTLGVYVAASLLMQHSIGPRLFGDMPVLAALGYALALWFTLRLARHIAVGAAVGDSHGPLRTSQGHCPSLCANRGLRNGRACNRP
jgi:hypothetical protein